MPDQLIDPALAPDEGALTAALAATLSPHAEVPDADLRAHAQLICHDDGNRVLARLIRYVEERRRAERRFTGAIERHPSPLGVVWGVDDPIALVSMTERLEAARPDATVVHLERVGHYPVLERPDRFLDAVLPLLDGAP
jgi:pimeloyl-ACP methyl ester carboxylesterase